MTKSIAAFLLLFTPLLAHGQSIDEVFSKKKMRKDFEVFKEIRLKANSGLYKYRTHEQIDSIYDWAESEIEKSNTYLEFFNIICQLTDFEGSCHNNTDPAEKYVDNMREEADGYFPYPIKWTQGKWLVNYENDEIPLGAEIIAVNGKPIAEVISNLYKYYPTDGENLTGKRIGIRAHFGIYYRYKYGRQKAFRITYSKVDDIAIEEKSISSVSYMKYYERFRGRHSRKYDNIYYRDLKPNQKYTYKEVAPATSLLTIHSFGMGNENSVEHKAFAAFLDSVFLAIKTNGVENLIIDIRINGGGDDPNDVLAYSYLTSRNFQESREAWISFQKLPLVKHYDSSIPRFLRPFGVGKYNKRFRKRYSVEKEGRYYIGQHENEMKVWSPHPNAFTGNIYLMTSPAVASAGSLFGAMVAGNENTTVIGEETMGGYYGHNGHTPLEYVLPKSKIEIEFFIDNIDQDVPIKDNQRRNRGIIPDYEVPQSTMDFLDNKDTQMEFVLELIGKS